MSWPTSYNRLCCPREKMACQNRRDPTMSAFLGPCAHAMPNVFLSCVLSKGDDNVPRHTLSNRVCFPSAIMACHARRRPIVCSVKGDNGVPRPMSTDCVFCPRAMMACHVLRHSIVCDAQGPCEHSTPDIVRSCVLSNVDENMPRLTSSNRVCFRRLMMVYHARRGTIVCSSLGR